MTNLWKIGGQLNNRVRKRGILRLRHQAVEAMSGGECCFKSYCVPNACTPPCGQRKKNFQGWKTHDDGKSMGSGWKKDDEKTETKKKMAHDLRSVCPYANKINYNFTNIITYIYTFVSIKSKKVNCYVNTLSSIWAIFLLSPMPKNYLLNGLNDELLSDSSPLCLFIFAFWSLKKTKTLHTLLYCIIVHRKKSQII